MASILEGKVALVTGSSKGVGKGIALELARNGCDVAVNFASDEEGAKRTAREVRGLGRKAAVFGASVGVSSDVDRMFTGVLSEFGRLDILVNNAGVQTWKPLLELTEEEWDRTIDTNLKGCFLCTQRAARHMKDHGGGNVINLGSGCNKVAFPKLVDYTASKGGIEMFTKVAAVELGKHKIRVNCVAPGPIEIERTRLESPDYEKSWRPLVPTGRVGYPEDIGKTVVFLVSDAADFISGQTLYVDGGLFSRPAWPYDEGAAE